MKNKFFHFLWATLLTLALFSWASTVLASEISLQKQLASGEKAVITFAANPLLTMTETPFTIELLSPTGEAVEDAAVNLRLIMPAMAMPPNNPKALWQENSYRGSAVFTMAGVWEIIMVLNQDDKNKLESSLGLVQVMMK